ncbi:hypothetical protein KSF78_0008012 [Schistosoma japonicum]|nr:hypothetical protein KSF78_0008012 [Schistosoma japonicum]
MQVNVSNNFQKRNVTSSCWSNPIFLTSFVTMIVGLIMAIIVACVEKLHSPTLANTIIVAITVTIYTLGVILYMYLNDLTYDIISVVVAFVLAVPSVLFSFRVTRLSKKWKIIIFSIMCALYAIMIAALIALKFAHKLATLVAVSCFCLMIIVIVLTPYFFKLYDLTKDYTLYYLLLVFLFEIVCSCSLMLFSFTPIDPLSCENKTVSN